jgi:hypothetical protein
VAGLLVKRIFLAGFLFAAVTTIAGAQPGLGFPMIGIASGESARLNALNLGTASSTPDSSCGVTLQILDTDGKLIKQKIVTLQAGKAASMDIGSDELLGTNASRAEIRAVLIFGYPGGANPPPAVLAKFDCNIVPSLEIFDNITNRTSYILTDAKLLPGQAAPAQ